MKVKELRKIFNELPEDWEVVMSDVDGKCLEIIKVSHARSVVYLGSRQEFPEDWYYNGEEVRQVFGNAIRLNRDECEDDLEVEGYGEVRLQLHDGYAEGDGVRLEYPKLKDLTDEQLEEMDKLLGGRILDSGVVVFSDVCLAYGKIVKPKEEKKPRFVLDQDTHLLCESIQEITLYAWPIIWDNNKYDQDSRNVLETIREWGAEFENYWQGQLDKDENYMDTHSYMEEIDHFAKKKCDEYLEWLKN